MAFITSPVGQRCRGVPFPRRVATHAFLHLATCTSGYPGRRRLLVASRTPRIPRPHERTCHSLCSESLLLVSLAVHQLDHVPRSLADPKDPPRSSRGFLESHSQGR